MQRLITAAVYNYRKALLQELKLRKKANTRYSLRAFARDLGLSPSMLSEVLSRQKGLSLELAKRLAHQLKLPAKESEAFLHSVLMFHDPSEFVRYQSFLKLKHMQLAEGGSAHSMPPEELDGLWQAVVRVSSSGAVPQYWDPKQTNTYFMFSKGRMEYTSRNSKTGQFHIFGYWEFEKNVLYTPTSFCETFNRPQDLPFPWLAVSHQVVRLSRDSFSLSTSSNLLGSQICPPGDSLETIWKKVY